MSDEYANDIILVEFPETPGLQPVSIRTLSVDSLAEKSARAVNQAMNTIRHMAKRTVTSIKGLTDPPDKIEVSFGLTMSGELGSALISSVGAEASINVKMTWQREEKPVAKMPNAAGLLPSKE